MKPYFSLEDFESVSRAGTELNLGSLVRSCEDFPLNFLVAGMSTSSSSSSSSSSANESSFRFLKRKREISWKMIYISWACSLLFYLVPFIADLDSSFTGFFSSDTLGSMSGNGLLITSVFRILGGWRGLSSCQMKRLVKIFDSQLFHFMILTLSISKSLNLIYQKERKSLTLVSTILKRFSC